MLCEGMGECATLSLQVVRLTRKSAIQVQTIYHSSTELQNVKTPSQRVM